jgi:hypothetical protein
VPNAVLIETTVHGIAHEYLYETLLTVLCHAQHDW